MRFEMEMPRLTTMDSEIRIVGWKVEPGQIVQCGQILLEVESGKAILEVESTVTGVLAEIHSPADQVVAAGQVIASFEVEGALPASTKGLVAPSLTPMDESAIELSLAQRVAAKRLQESKQVVPHFYLQTSANVAGIVAYRKANASEKPVWDAFYVLAVARAIAKFDRFRYRFHNGRLLPINSDAVGVAIGLEDDLFVVPIGSPLKKTVEQISSEIWASVDRLRSGDRELRQLHPIMMTVSNLGLCKIESFVPIINPPEPAILGVARVLPTPVGCEDGSIVVEPRCNLTLSVDHRVASGLYATRFLETIVQEFESSFMA